MKNTIVLTLFILISMSVVSLTAQNPFTLELRGGVDFATQDLGQAGLKPGISLEGIADYKFFSNLGVYAGWGWNKFTAESSYVGVEHDFEETGYMLGLSTDYPVGRSPIAIYARAGGIYNHIEIENAKGDIIEDSGHGWGWQICAGIDLSLGAGWQLKPGAKYQSLSRDLKMESIKTPVDLNYLQVSIGIAKNF
jgi:hypothetical protein